MGRVRRSVVFTLVLTCVSGASFASASEPALTGLYRVGGVGIVDVSMAEGQVVGRLKLAEECGEIPLETPVLQGAFEGGLFVGSVTVCQSGGTCVARKSYPFLGFWIADELVGTVKLDSGCESSALDQGLLKVTSADADDRQKVLGNKAGSAADVAKSAAGKTPEQLVKETAALMADGKYVEAQVMLQAALKGNEQNVGIRYQLGMAYLGSNRAGLAIEHLEIAARLAREKKMLPELVGKAYFNLACALAHEKKKKEAIDALNTGFDASGVSGFGLKDLQEDKDLESVRGDPAFKKLAAKVALAGGGKPRGKSPK